jgi:hypothetical protein
MKAFMEQAYHKKIFKERATRVEPMQGLAKDTFELDHCWMRGDTSNQGFLQLRV